MQSVFYTSLSILLIFGKLFASLKTETCHVTLVCAVVIGVCVLSTHSVSLCALNVIHMM